MTEQCIYCGHDVCVDRVPDIHDDEAWEIIAAEHAKDCEWVLTRAHRLEEDEDIATDETRSYGRHCQGKTSWLS